MTVAPATALGGADYGLHIGSAFPDARSEMVGAGEVVAAISPVLTSTLKLHVLNTG
jgi:hypothetical protein